MSETLITFALVVLGLALLVSATVFVAVRVCQMIIALRLRREQQRAELELWL